MGGFASLYLKALRLFSKSNYRAAEIILALTKLSGKPGSSWRTDETTGLPKSLATARQSLSLFQHHDGITGTAKDHVVVNYGNK